MKFSFCYSLGLLLLFTSCGSAQVCMKFDQSFVEYRDSGYRDLYVCKKKPIFFDKYYLERDNVSVLDRDSNVNLFLASTKVINENYYTELSDIINNMLIDDTGGEGAIWVKHLDNQEKVMKEGAIPKSALNYLKDLILDLNKKYKIGNSQNREILSFFQTVEKGVKID